LDRVSVKAQIEVEGEARGLPGLAERDLEDPQYVKIAIGRLISVLVPSYALPPTYEFRIISGDDGFFIATDLDFAAINANYHKSIPPTHSTITAAYLIDHLLEARADIYFASEYMAELVTSSAYSAIIQVKLRDILRKRERNTEQIALFQSTYLKDAHAIRSAINSGEKSFSDFLPVLEQASKFKEWLRSQNPDESVLSQYLKAATAETWVDKLPSKTTRFVIATGIGIAADLIWPSGAGTVLGIGVGAGDSLVLDRISKGWRPNQFVEGPLQKFVDE
jgi:hypothetical protein